jgi:hypothetical protein
MYIEFNTVDTKVKLYTTYKKQKSSFGVNMPVPVVHMYNMLTSKIFLLAYIICIKGSHYDISIYAYNMV